VKALLQWTRMHIEYRTTSNNGQCPT